MSGKNNTRHPVSRLERMDVGIIIVIITTYKFMLLSEDTLEFNLNIEYNGYTLHLKQKICIV